MGGIETARHADDHALDADGTQSLRQAGDLDVVSLVTVLLEPCGIGWNKGIALGAAFQADVCVRRIETEANVAERRWVPMAIDVEAAHLHALVAQQVQVDISHCELAG